MHKLSETKKRWISLVHFSREIDHDSNEQSKSNQQSNSKARATSNRTFCELADAKEGLETLCRDHAVLVHELW